MHEYLFSLTIGEREVEVKGWQAALVAGVLVGMPWVVGIVTIARTALG